MITVSGSRELQAVVLALKVVDRTLAADIRKATVSTMGPVWTAEIAGRARTTRDRLVLAKGARIAGGNPPSGLAGSSSRRMSGGGRPSELAGGVEFGSSTRNAKTRYSTQSPKGTVYTVNRRTKRQFPNRATGGRVVFPAFMDIGPRMVALWVQLVVRKVYQATEG